MPYEVYTISGAPRPWRVLLALVAKQIDFAHHVLDASKKEHKMPEFLALNARGRVPVLKTDDFVLTESLAIIAHLERAHPQPPLFGTNSEEHARIWELASVAAHDLSDAASALLRPIFSQGRDEQDEGVQKAASAVHGELKRLEHALQNSLHLGANRMTAADCVAFPHVRLVLRAGERHPETMGRLELHPLRYPRVVDWVKRVESMPGYEKTFPTHWNRPDS